MKLSRVRIPILIRTILLYSSQKNLKIYFQAPITSFPPKINIDGPMEKLFVPSSSLFSNEWVSNRGTKEKLHHTVDDLITLTSSLILTIYRFILESKNFAERSLSHRVLPIRRIEKLFDFSTTLTIFHTFYLQLLFKLFIFEKIRETHATYASVGVNFFEKGYVVSIQLKDSNFKGNHRQILSFRTDRRKKKEKIILRRNKRILLDTSLS